MTTRLVTTEEVAAERLCVVFDRTTGALVHVHEIFSLRGGRQPSESEAAAETLALTRQFAETQRLPIPPVAQLEVLSAPPGSLEADARYRGDLATRRLVRVDDADSPA